jgi:hypothetical protein
VSLACRSIDRIFLRAYVPKLQSVGLVCRFLRWQRGFAIPSSAAFGKIGPSLRDRGASVGEGQRHPGSVHYFAKGENKEQVARPLLEVAAAEGGQGRVVLVGIAQERASVWRSWKARATSMRRIRTWSGADRWRSAPGGHHRLGWALDPLLDQQAADDRGGGAKLAGHAGQGGVLLAAGPQVAGK